MPSNGETNLDNLLASMKPMLHEGEYVFCSIAKGKYGDYTEASPIAAFIEQEGMTLVLERQSAELYNLQYDSIFKAITLTVHSSLEAVGLTAVVASKLAENGISANVIAGYYHDHIFVQSEKAELAMDVLNEFSS